MRCKNREKSRKLEESKWGTVHLDKENGSFLSERTVPLIYLQKECRMKELFC